MEINIRLNLILLLICLFIISCAADMGDTDTPTDANTDTTVKTDSVTGTNTNDETAPFTLGNIVLKGNGCSEGNTTDVVRNPDGYELSINFGEFSVSTEATPYAFANCNIAVPINIPPGIKVGIIGGSYRGVAFIPSGGSGQLSSEHFFAGNDQDQSGEKIIYEIDTYDQLYEYLFEDKLGVAAWSNCGESTIARSNATVMVSAPENSTVSAMMSVSSEINFHLVWESCGE